MPSEAVDHGQEAFSQKIDPELSKALDAAADFVTHNVDLVINGTLIEHPFQGTFTTAAVLVGAREAEGSIPAILTAASAKRKSEHLEETMGYGPLDPIAVKKAEQLVGIASQVPSDKLRSSQPQTAEQLIADGNERVWMGAARLDSNPHDNLGSQAFIVGTSGGEASRELIQAMFPNETFDFDADPTQLERGAGLIDEIVSRLVGGVMVAQAVGYKLGEGRVTLELTELQPDQIAATEEAVRNVPGNQTEAGKQIVSID